MRLAALVCVTLVCVMLVGGEGSRKLSRCHGLYGVAWVCNATAATSVPPVVGGKTSKVARVQTAGLWFRCRAHVYPGGYIIRCVLAKSPLAA